jgi:hypothetical protein
MCLEVDHIPANPSFTTNVKGVKKRPYVGLKHGSPAEVIHSATPVTPQTHSRFHTVKGAFRTKKAAEFLAKNAHKEAISKLSVNGIEKLVQELNAV